MATPLVGETILCDRYRLVGTAGQGVFGLTYLAQDLKRFNELCVVKEWVPNVDDPVTLVQLRHAFHQAVAPLYDLQHPQIPSLQPLLIHNQRLYLIRDYIAGKSYGALLDERREHGQTFSLAEMVELFIQVLPVLAVLHRQGLVHQNLSPDTLIYRGDDHPPALIDLGLIKQQIIELGLHPVAPNVQPWLPNYAAPEQITARMTYPNSDLYALATTAIALLTGQEPAPNVPLRSQSSDFWSQIDPPLARLLQHMLHPDPRQRIASADQVLQQLDRWLLAKPMPAAVPAPPRPAVPLPQPRRTRSHRRQASLLSGGVLLLLGGVGLVGAIAWNILSAAYQPLQMPLPETAVSPEPLPPTPVPAPPAPPPSPTPIPSLQATPQSLDLAGLRDRRRQLGIPYDFFTTLVDAEFYAKHPDWQGKKIGSGDEQQALREEWLRIAEQCLTALQSLSPETRSKLGTYQRSDYERWRTRVQSQLSDADLTAQVNQRFRQLFPERRPETLDAKTLGQVWYAIADDVVRNATPTNPPTTNPPN